MHHSNELKITGGTRIGNVRASWPFATLKVNQQRLELKVSMMGSFVFMPSDIVSIEGSSAASLFGSSIRIVHRVKEYNQEIFFQYAGSAAELISQIHQTGFLSSTTEPTLVHIDAELLESRSNSGFALKTPAAIGIIVIWNLCCIIDFSHLFDGSGKTPFLGVGMKLALGFMIVLCVSLLTAEPVRRLLLKKGRSIDDVKSFLYFILVICGILMAVNLFLVK